MRADVHALAAVAYQMLTGRLAREGSISELVHAGLPVAPSRLNPELPAEVDEVLLRSLDPEPDTRYSDIESFVEAFRAALPVSSPPPRARATRYQTPDTVAAPLTAAASSTPSRRPSVLLALLCVLIFAATFGAAYAVTTLVS